MKGTLWILGLNNFWMENLEDSLIAPRGYNLSRTYTMYMAVTMYLISLD